MKNCKIKFPVKNCKIFLYQIYYTRSDEKIAKLSIDLRNSRQTVDQVIKLIKKVCKLSKFQHLDIELTRKTKFSIVEKLIKI